MKTYLILLLAVCAIQFASAITVTVPGKACPWLAGAPDGTSGIGDVAPNASPTMVRVHAGEVLQFSSSGATYFTNSAGSAVDAEGVTGYYIGQSAVNGISGVTSVQVSSLVGVFLADAVPTSGGEPASVDFSGTAKDYTTLAPLLRQIFFIGDGHTSGNVSQQITVPAGATRLFLGTVDGSGWYDNYGSLSVTISGIATPSLSFSATGPASAGAPIHFAATTETGWSVRVQKATVATPAEADWSDLTDGNSGQMTETAPGSGNFVLDTTAYPAGTGISFRAIAAKTGETDLVAPPLGPYNLHQAVLSIGATLISTSDFAHGYTAYIDDFLIYKLTFKNTGDADAKTLRVTAAVPTFRSADIPLLVKTKIGNPTITLASGDTSQLSLGGSFAVGPGLGGSVVGNVNGSVIYIPLAAKITAITDATHFTIDRPATSESGTYIVSTLVQYASKEAQFAQSDLTLSLGGTYVPETSPGAGDAKLQWDVGDLPGVAGVVYSNYVTFNVHLTSKVRTEQDIILPSNTYSVLSTSTPPQPVTGTTGYSSGSPTQRCRINGNISFKLNPLATTVAPGGYLSYVFSLTNRGTTTAENPVAEVDVPDNMRFANAYPMPSGTKAVVLIGGSAVPGPIPAVPVANTLYFKQVYRIGSTTPQVVIKFPALAAKKTVQVKVTFQAKWADPNQVPKISSLNYGAAFLDKTQPKPISAVAAFTTLFNAASSNPTAPGSTDFFALISDPANKLARSTEQSGRIDVALRGTLDGQPVLSVFKQISNTLAKTEVQAGANSIDIVKPGEKLNFILVVSNNGDSPADEVFVQDAMPDHTTFVSAALVALKTKSTTASKLATKPDTDGHHLLFTGMHLEPHDALAFVLTVLVDNSLTVPPLNGPPLYLDVGAFSVGSGSTTVTPVGFATAKHVKVIGTVKYAQPRLSKLIAEPLASANMNATKTALDTLYAAKPSAKPLTNSLDFLSYIPGVQRLYVHYENIGNAAATGFKLTVPIPANAAFYRASWVTLAANINPGGIPQMPGTIAAAPAGGTITKPTVLDTSGNVVFNLPTLSGTAKGDVMVEVIVTPDAVAALGSHIGDPSQTIRVEDSASNTASLSMPQMLVRDGAPAASQSAAVSSFSSAAPPPPARRVPSIGLMRILSTPNVAPGQQFTLTLCTFNYGDVGCTPLINFKVPVNTKLISIAVDHDTYIPQPADAVAGTIGSYVAISNNAGKFSSVDGSLTPHSASAITLTLQATGALGTSIVDDQSFVRVSFHDDVRAVPATVKIVNPAILPTLMQDSQFDVVGWSFSTLINGARLVDLGGGNFVVQGNANTIAEGPGTVIAQSQGNIVFAGQANFNAVQHPLGLGAVSISSLLANNSIAITAPKDANGLPLPTLGNLVVQNSDIVAGTTAGRIVAQGGGNIVAQGGGNIVAQGGGNIVAQGGGNIVAQGGGNIVAQGGGNIIAAAGGSIVAQGGGNIVAQGGGNIVAQGGGNIVAQGGGN